MNRTQALRVGFSLAALLHVTAAMAQNSTATPPASAQKTAQKAAATTSSATQYHSEGERVFAQNCSRCHNPPEAFSPRVSGTIARHMRVRAQISARDEQALLQFLNP